LPFAASRLRAFAHGPIKAERRAALTADRTPAVYFADLHANAQTHNTRPHCVIASNPQKPFMKSLGGFVRLARTVEQVGSRCPGILEG
jgi:hypothetical protein